jgi:hypothetical protein
LPVHVLFGDDNDIRINEVWESREKLDAFGDKLWPGMEGAGSAPAATMALEAAEQRV